MQIAHINSINQIQSNVTILIMFCAQIKSQGKYRNDNDENNKTQNAFVGVREMMEINLHSDGHTKSLPQYDDRNVM